MRLIGVDDRAHQVMANNVAFVEVHGRDSRHVFHRLQRLDDAGPFVCRKIDRRYIAGHDASRVRPDARQQHEHLLGGAVLSFIENDEGIVRSAAAHICERSDFDRLPSDRSLHFLRIEHVS